MSKGILLFALNNDSIDYTKLAVFAAKRAKQQLNVPVTVVTDSRSQLLTNDTTKIIDSIVDVTDDTSYSRRFYDGHNNYITLPWKNTSRYTCFDLSPYEETLVIDVDFIINSPTLSCCWENPHDFLIHKIGFDMAQTESINYVSDYSVPFYWATVFYFKKTQRVKLFFILVQHIKNNWEYYRLLYELPDKKFRNDFAFSIAIHMMNGFSKEGFVNFLPGKLYYTSDRSHILELNESYIKILLESNNGYVPVKVKSLDVHLMNKFSLLRLLEDE